MSYSLDYAWSLHSQGQFELAASVCSQILKSEPDNPAALCCKAMSNWSRSHNIEGALKDMRRAVKLAPQIGGLRHNLATVLASLGKLEDACHQFRRALKINRLDAEAFYGLSQNMRFVHDEPLVKGMRMALKQEQLPDRLREFAAFGLAKIYDDLGRHKEAIKYIDEANRYGKRFWDMGVEEARLSQLDHLAETERFAQVKDSGEHSEAPIFIVGMPRSGTTLVENILARHQSVFAGGELMFLPLIERAIVANRQQKQGENQGVDLALLDVGAEEFASYAQQVLREVKKKSGRAFPRFTDKLPHNSERVGLISKLFPKARIIYVRRHPLDTGISNLFIRFNQGHGYSYDQQLTGQHFRNVSRTMENWRKIAGIPILDVSYEQLIKTPQEVARQMLEFVGLEWSRDCLSPEKVERGVLSASQWQVRQPIYAHAVARWVPYENWLEPMIRAMGGRDWIERYQTQVS